MRARERERERGGVCVFILCTKMSSNFTLYRVVNLCFEKWGFDLSKSTFIYINRNNSFVIMIVIPHLLWFLLFKNLQFVNFPLCETWTTNTNHCSRFSLSNSLFLWGKRLHVQTKFYTNFNKLGWCHLEFCVF